MVREDRIPRSPHPRRRRLDVGISLEAQGRGLLEKTRRAEIAARPRSETPGRESRQRKDRRGYRSELLLAAAVRQGRTAGKGRAQRPRRDLRQRRQRQYNDDQGRSPPER